MNWRMESGKDLSSWLNMADGYMMASIEIVERSLRDNRSKEADILIFPAMNAAIHGMELYLKGINWALNHLADSKNTVEGRHNIRQIFKLVESKMKSKSPGELRAFKVEMNEIESFIEEIFQKAGSTDKNDKMDFTRYPFGRNDEDHFYADGWINVEVDLDNLSHRLTVIHRKLKDFSDHYLQLFYLSQESFD
jgi:hypothetical protein